MSLHKNRVKMTVTGAPGTGTITLSAAVAQYQSLATAYGANATVDLLYTDAGNVWGVERDCSYVHSGTMITRGTAEDGSSGAGVAVTLTSAAVVSVIATAGWGNDVENLLSNGRFSAASRTGSANSATLTANAWTKVLAAQINSEILDSSGWFDVSTARYTPQRAGYYVIGGLVLAYISTTGKKLLVAAGKNGAAANSDIYILSRGISGAVNTHGFGGSQLIYMNGSTDYVEMFVQCEDTGAYVVANYDNASMFWGYWVGA